MPSLLSTNPTLSRAITPVNGVIDTRHHFSCATVGAMNKVRLPDGRVLPTLEHLRRTVKSVADGRAKAARKSRARANERLLRAMRFKRPGSLMFRLIIPGDMTLPQLAEAVNLTTVECWSVVGLGLQRGDRDELERRFAEVLQAPVSVVSAAWDEARAGAPSQRTLEVAKALSIERRAVLKYHKLIDRALAYGTNARTPVPEGTGSTYRARQ